MRHAAALFLAALLAVLAIPAGAAQAAEAHSAPMPCDSHTISSLCW
jgi:hypothetical protein